MLSDAQKEGLEAMSREDQIKLLALIREAKALFGGGGGACMPQSAIDDLVKAVPDELVRDIVHDLRKVAEPGGFLPASENSVRNERSSGWQKPQALDVPPGIKYIDRALDVQDALDRRDLEKRLR
jgi:hypothetical protein